MTNATFVVIANVCVSSFTSNVFSMVNIGGVVGNLYVDWGL